MYLVPVGLVVYNRIEHTKRVIEALKKNTLASDTDLYIFSDAPSRKEDEKAVFEIREYIKTLNDGFKNVYIYESQKNLGIKYSTIKAVNTIFEKHEYFIGLEDDIETNKYFLEFMNNALNYYKDDEDVISVTAFSHKHATEKHKYDVIFTYAFHSWGWGTWRSKWQCINWDTCDISWYNKSIKHKILGSVFSWFHLLAVKKSVKQIMLLAGTQKPHIIFRECVCGVHLYQLTLSVKVNLYRLFGNHCLKWVAIVILHTGRLDGTARRN